MPKITPNLWFEDQAEEAMNFYASIFKDSKKGNVTRYLAGTPGPEGQVMTAEFEIEGQPFVALNGGPEFKFSPAISFIIACEDQAEVDHYWDSLIQVGEPDQCGWLRDKFGLSWQVVPTVLNKMMEDPDPAKSQRVMEQLLEMVKLDIKPLEDAYNSAG